MERRPKRRLNAAALRVYERGHVPVTGMNNALPVLPGVEGGPPVYEDVMRISLALAERCDGILVIGSSPGVDAEVARIEGRGLPVWRDVEDVPAPKS